MRFLIFPAAMVLAFAACGGDDDSSGNVADPGADGSVPDPGSSSTSSNGGPSTSSSGGTPTQGCGAAVAKSGFLGSQTLNGRTYELYLPDGYDPSTPYPVAIVFHGDGGTGASARSSFKLEDASGKKAIIAYPDGLAKTWNTDDLTKMKADITFIEQLVGDLEAKYCAAKGRVLAVGFSRGAYFVNQFACRSNLLLTAVSAHGGGGPFQVKGEDIYNSKGDLECPKPAPPAQQVIGQNDSVSEAQKPRDYYRRIDACQTATSPYDPSPCVKYNGCTKDEVYCEIPGLGHAIWDKGAAATWKFFTEQK